MSRNYDRSVSVSVKASQVLRRRFIRHPIAKLGELCRTLRVSGRTVFRLLSKIGYHSSYSHAGRFYTLTGIPCFGKWGLWFYNGVGFSGHGTLRKTVIFLVEEAPAGHTHQELEAILNLRVHDTLRALVNEKCIARREVDAIYVYVSAEPSTAKKQLEKRRKLSVPTSVQPTPTAAPDAARIIEVLLAVIQRPEADAVRIAARLRAQGIVLTCFNATPIYFKALHESKALPIKAALVGGFPLHIDATCETGRGTLFVAYCGDPEWVLEFPNPY